MIISRSSTLMKFYGFPGRYLLENKVTKCLENSKRSHGGSWVYRREPPPNAKTNRWTENIGAFVWWWITWHFVTDWRELIAYPFPDPSEWTDEELGVPPL